MKKPFLVLRILLGAGTLFAQNQDIVHGKWYASFIGNKQVGFVNEALRQNGNESVQSTFNKVSITRGTTKAEVSVEAEYVEDLTTGMLKTISSKMKMSNQETQNTFINEKDSITLTQQMGGKSYTRKMASQGNLYGPLWVKNNSAHKLKREGDVFQYKTFSPEFGQFLNGTRRVIALDKVNGVNTLVVEESFAEMPFKRKLWVNEKFETLKTVDATPFGEMESLLTSKENAQADLSLVSFPADFFDRTFAASNVRLRDARSMQSVTLRIVKRSEATVTIPDLSNDFQEVLESTNQYTVLKISVPSMRQKPMAKSPLAKEILAEFIQPNALINSDDDEIKKIAREVTRGLKTDYEKCLALENWVTNNMKFDMGIVLAPASEVCRERKGTCASYSTFLAALFRAANIPSRYNMGFVYMGATWGGHAWPDAYIDGQWIPFDAAVNGEGSADAARFSFGTTSFKNGAGEVGTMPGGRLYGSVDVKVLAYVANDKEHKLAEDKKSYEVNNSTYTNPSLGLTIRKPEGFEFRELDETWPNYTVASLVNLSANEKVTIVQTMLMPAKSKDDAIKSLLQKQIAGGVFNSTIYKGTKVALVESNSEAAIAVPKGQDVWVIRTKSNRPSELLAKAIEWVEL